MKKLFTSQLGMGAMELVAGMVAVGAVALGGASLLKNLGSQAKGGDVRQEIQSYTDEISKLLNNKTACRNSMNGKNASSGTVLSILDKAGAPKFSVGDILGTNQIKIVSMKLQDLPGLDDTVEVVPGDEGSTRLEIKFAQVKEGSTVIRKTLNLFVFSEGASPTTATISDCFATLTGGGSFWIKDGTNADNIYYNEGFVGAGIQDPQFPLDVNGTIAVSNAGEAIELTGIPSQFEIRLSNITKPLEFLVGAGAGTYADIKARDITAGSYIKLAASTGNCDGTNNGAIRYNSGTKKVEMCEGAAWVTKEYEQWCVPQRIRKEQDDNGMYFHQADNSRREFGTGCDRLQINRREDNTSFNDLKIAAPDYGYRIRHDHSSDPCVNDQLCQTYRDIDQ